MLAFNVRGMQAKVGVSIAKDLSQGLKRIMWSILGSFHLTLVR